MARLAANTWLPLRLLRQREAAGPAAPGSARREARRAVLFGACAFCLATVALAAAVETVRPEWRDPEYGRRLRQVRHWQQARPDRPLVLVAGSSRTQYGVSPADMGFADGPGSPLVYNFGYRAAHPLGVWLQVSRAIEDGAKPRAVLIQLAALELRHEGTAEWLYLEERNWGPRFSAADVRRLAPFARDPRAFEPALAAARLRPWVSRRESIVSDLLPNWQNDSLRLHHRAWEGMDQHGFAPIPHATRTPEFLRTASEEAKLQRASLTCPLGETSTRALRHTIAYLQSRGITVGLFWAPESSAYRAMYTPAGRAIGEAFAQQLTREYGVVAFPAPVHLVEEDFADGFHLLPVGAAKYSRWLADNHLKPWLARVLRPEGDR